MVFGINIETLNIGITGAVITTRNMSCLRIFYQGSCSCIPFR